METGHPSTRAVNSGSGNRALVFNRRSVQTMSSCSRFSESSCETCSDGDREVGYGSDATSYTKLTDGSTQPVPLYQTFISFRRHPVDRESSYSVVERQTDVLMW